MSGEPVDVRAWFERWLSTDVVAGRSWRVDPFQHAMIEQAWSLMDHFDHGMRVAGVDLAQRTTALSFVFTRLTARTEQQRAERLAREAALLDPAAVADLLINPGEDGP